MPINAPLHRAAYGRTTDAAYGRTTDAAELLTLHCALGQGYLFAKPVPAPELAALLAAGLRSTADAPI